MNPVQTTVPATFSTELFSRWIRYIDASPKTVATYSRSIRRFVAYLEEHNITNPTREDVIAYRDFLKDTLKPATVQSYLTSVKIFFSWTETEGLYPNVAHRIKGVKIETVHKKDALTAEQTLRLLESVDRSTLQGMRDYALLLLMVTTGLREISVVRADVGDIRNVADQTVLFYQGKGRSEKTEYVKLAPETEEALRTYLAERDVTDPAAPLFACVSNRNADGRLTTRSVSRIAKTRLVAIGLNSDRLTGHSLRHTAATLNMACGGSVEETQQLLGHSNINTTMIYAHALERSRNISENRIAESIFSSGTATAASAKKAWFI